MMRYVLNRARAMAREACELAVMGGELRDTGTFSFRDAQREIWELPEGELGEHANQRGLWGQRQFVSDAEGADIIKKSMEGATLQPYEGRQRLLAPILLCDDVEDLRDLEVFGGLPPEQWPRLVDPPAFLGRVSRAFGARPRFAQIQFLERGTPVLPHIDAASPRSEAVATITLQGSATVRVGAVEFEARERDIYILVGPARWDVKHEVLASQTDRLSVTTRYAVEDSTTT